MVYFDDAISVAAFLTSLFVVSLAGVGFGRAIFQNKRPWVKVIWGAVLAFFVFVPPIIASERLWWADMAIFISMAVLTMFLTRINDVECPGLYVIILLAGMMLVTGVDLKMAQKTYRNNLIVLNEEVYKETKREQYEMTGSGMNRSANVKLSDVEFGLCVVTYEDRDDCEVVWTDRYEVILNQNYREPRKEEKLAETIITIKMPVPSEISASNEMPAFVGEIS